MKLSEHFQSEIETCIRICKSIEIDSVESGRLQELRVLLMRAEQLEQVAADLVAWDQRYPKDRIFESEEEARRPEKELNDIVAAAKEIL